MGFEPTTFCMASSCLLSSPGVECLQMKRFAVSPSTRRFNECGRIVAGLDTERTPRECPGPASEQVGGAGVRPRVRALT
jgi:hypothetical protein